MRELRRIRGAGLQGSRRAVAVAVVVCSLAFAGFAMSSGFTVSLGPAGPGPGTVTVNWGDSIAFANTDTVTHGITSSRPELNASIAPGQTYTAVVTGRRDATYNYRQTGGGPSVRGKVVSHIVGSVTLQAPPPVTGYGKSIVLTGTSSFSPVRLQQRQHGVTGWKTIASIPVGAGGTFARRYTPSISAKLRATTAGGQLRSLTRVTAVLPTVTISTQARRTRADHKVTIAGRLTPGKAGDAVTLLQCNAGDGNWRRVASKKPGASGGVVFRWTAEAGRNFLRTAVLRADLTPGYLPPASGKISIVGVGTAPKKKPGARC